MNIAVALAASRAGSHLRRRARDRRNVLGRLTGAIFIGLGVRLAIASRR